MPVPSDPALSRLAGLRLPALDYNLRRIRTALDRPATSHLVLARLVSDDPGLVLALMQRLGADPRRPDPTPASPLQIIGLLGRRALQEVLADIPVLETGHQEPVLGGLRAAYGRAIHAAAFARRLATLGGIGPVDEVPVLALLGNLLGMVLWVGHPELVTSLGAAGARPEPWFARATEALQAERLPTPALARLWQLPDSLCRALTPEPDEDRAVQLSRLSLALSWAAHWDWYAPETLALIEEIADLLELTPDLLQGILHREAAETARLMWDLGLPHCMDRLLLPTDVPWRQASAPLGSQEEKPPAAPKAGEKAPPPSNPPRQNLSRDLSRILTRLRTELGMERAMFAMLTPDRRRLRARFVIGDGDRSGLRNFDLPIKDDNLFTRMLRERQALWVDSGNLVTHLPEIPPAVANLLSSDGFFAAPVVVKGRVIGMLYGDGKGPQDAQTFKMFQALTQETARVLSSSVVRQDQGAGVGAQATHRHQPEG